MGNCNSCSTEDRGSNDVEEPNTVVASNEPVETPTSMIDKDADQAKRPMLDEGSPSEEEGFLEDLTPKNICEDKSDKEDKLNSSGAEDPATFMRQVSISSTSYAPLQRAVSDPVEGRAEKLGRLASQRGFFVALDQTSSEKVLLKQNGSTSNGDIQEKVHQLFARIVANASFDASQVLGVFMSRESMERHVGQQAFVRYLSREKKIVPLLNLENSLMPQSKGVQLFKEEQDLEDSLQVAVVGGAFGIRIHSVVKQANAAGIKALVNQQFNLAKRIMVVGLLPVLHIFVDIKASVKNQISREAALIERHRSEEILFDQLLVALNDLRPDQRVMFELVLPAKPNTYLPLVGHPNTVRVLATTGNHSFRNACKALEQNFGLVASFGAIFIDGMTPTQNEKEFSMTLEKTIEKVYQASIAVPTKEMQTTKVAHTPGFFACVDSTNAKMDNAIQRYRLGTRSNFASDAEALNALHKMRCRIFTNTKFSGSRVIGVMMSEDTMQRSIASKPSAKYLWEDRQVVPFLTLDQSFHGEKDGVRLMKDIPKLDELLSRAVSAGIYGIKGQAFIKKPNPEGIKAVIAQQLSLSKKIMQKELVPVVHVEVEKDAVDKPECEQLFLEFMGNALAELRPTQKVLIWLAAPVQANLYLPLLGHPNVIRIVAVSGGHDREMSCHLVQQNYGLIGGFNRAFVQGMHSEQTDEEFTKLVDESCQAIFQSSRNVPVKTIQRYKAVNQDGFFAALAHLASRTEFSIAAQVNYGMSTCNHGEGIQPVFERIITNPQFNSLHVIGVSLTSEHLAMQVMGLPIAKYIWEEKHFVPFLKLDVNGMRSESDGVQLMEELDDHEFNRLLDMAANAGIFGTTALSKIRLPNSKGIHDLVEQQVSWAKRVNARGLVPVIMIFIDKEDAPEKDKCERALRHVLMKKLKTLEKEEVVMLNFILPSSIGYYDCFVTHPRVLRVMGSAGSYSLEECCRILSENPGLVGNFGTAILRNLNSSQTYAEFTQSISKACTEVHQAVKSASASSPRARARGSMYSDAFDE